MKRSNAITLTLVAALGGASLALGPVVAAAGAGASPFLAGSTTADPPSAFQRDVTDASFQKDVIEESQKRVVIIDFMTQWCSGCKEVKPPLVSKAAKDRYWLLAFVDCNKNPGIGGHIRKYPTFEAYYQGKIISRFDRDNFEISDMTGWIDETVRKANNGVIPAPGPDPAPGNPAPAPTVTNPPVPTTSTTAPKPPRPTAWPTRP